MKQEKVWDKIAGKWYEHKKKQDKEAIEFLKKQKGKVLDLGCGSGRHLIKNNMYGVDFSSKMLELAKKYIKKENIKAELVKIENENLPFSSSYFDSAIFIATLHCIERKKRKKILKELYRVLKKNKEALISVWNKIGRFKNKPKESHISWDVNGKKYKRYTYFYDKKELKEELRKAGFKIKKIWEEKGRVGNIYVIVKKI